MVNKSRKVMIYLLTFLTVLSGYMGSITPSSVKAYTTAIWESFDDKPTGTLGNTGGWYTDQTYGTAKIVTDATPGNPNNKSLKLTDNDYVIGNNNEYRSAPEVTRTFGTQTGKFTVETKIRLERLNNGIHQHFNVVFKDSSSIVASKLVYLNDRWNYQVGNTVIPMPEADFRDKWATIRLSYDFSQGKYDITVISDAYKIPTSADANLDSSTGTYTVKGLVIPTGINHISKVSYFSQNYYANFYIDYLALDNEQPVWSGGATLTTSEQTSSSVKLTWTGTVTDNTQSIAKYNIYNVATGVPTLVGTAAANTTSTTLFNIVPGVYRYKIETEDALGLISSGGPQTTATITIGPPSFKEGFDSGVLGTDWTVDQSFGTVQIVSDSTTNDPNNKSLKLTDNDYDAPVNEFRPAATATRNFSMQTGKFTLETKVRVEANSTANQHFNIVFMDGSSNIALKLFYSGGWKYYTSTGSIVSLPAANFLGEWVTIRIAFDISQHKYDMTVISDAYKTVTGSSNLDTVTGTYTQQGLNLPTALSNISKVLFLPQNYKGVYYIDYLTLDKAPPIWSGKLTVKNKRPKSVTLTWPAPTSVNNIAHYSIYEGNTLVQSTVGNVNEITINNLSAGTHTYRVEAVDVAGDMSSGGPALTLSFMDIATITNLLPPAGHPRLFLRAGDISTIQANFNQSPNKAAIDSYSNFNHSGELAAPASGTNTNYNEYFLYAIEAKALKYVLDKNNQQVMGRKAIDMLVNYLETYIRVPDESTTFSTWQGNVLMGGAMVYDWCYDLLTEAEKQFFVGQFVKLAKETTIGFPPSLASTSTITGRGASNYLTRDLLSIGVAIYDEIDEIYIHAAKLMKDEFAPAREFLYGSGMPYNGDSYGQSAYSYDATAHAIFTRMGLPPVFDNNLGSVPYRNIYTRTPDGDMLRDGDSVVVPNMGGNTLLPSTFLYSAGIFNDGYLKAEFLRQYALDQWNVNPIHVPLFINSNLASSPLSGLALTRYFDSPVGSMVARTGWNLGINSPDVVAEMKVSEYHFNNHNQLDTGAFQIYYKGSLALDSGVYGSYNDSHDKNYYKRTIAHNSMLIRNPNEVYTRWGDTLSNDGGVKWPNGGNEAANFSVFQNVNNGYKMSEIAGHQFGPDPVTPDYSFLKGDLTNAYKGDLTNTNDDRVSKYMRSFVFLNLKNSTHPAAMVVYDRVISTNPNFTKYWLLHSEEEPVVDVNTKVTTIKRSTNGYNGKLVNTPLLPLTNNLNVEKVGGQGHEYEVFGTNYPSTASYNSGLEPGSWRVQMSPITAQNNDGFLNVMQVMDDNGGPAPYATTMIDSTYMVGAKIADRVVLFSKSGDRLTNSVQFTVSDTQTNLKYVVTDLAVGTWNIAKQGQPTTQGTVTQEGNVLYFNGSPGTYTLTKN